MSYNLGTEPSSELDDILLELGSSEELHLDEVRAALAKHPRFSKEILEFAAEWIEADALAGMSGAVGDVELDHSAALEEFWSKSAMEAADPFEGIEAKRLKSIAAASEIHVTILMQFCNRLIEAATIPLVLVQNVARDLGTTPAVLLNHLYRPARLAAADYKADAAPTVDRKISFAAAVKAAPMTSAQKEKWLSMSDG